MPRCSTSSMTCLHPASPFSRPATLPRCSKAPYFVFSHTLSSCFYTQKPVLSHTNARVIKHSDIVFSHTLSALSSDKNQRLTTLSTEVRLTVNIYSLLTQYKNHLLNQVKTATNRPSRHLRAPSHVLVLLHTPSRAITHEPSWFHPQRYVIAPTATSCFHTRSYPYILDYSNT